MHVPEEASQTFTVRSSLDETMSRPSGDHLAHLTQLVCSVREEMNLVLCTAHTFKYVFVFIFVFAFVFEFAGLPLVSIIPICYR